MVKSVLKRWQEVTIMFKPILIHKQMWWTWDEEYPMSGPEATCELTQMESWRCIVVLDSIYDLSGHAIICRWRSPCHIESMAQEFDDRLWESSHVPKVPVWMCSSMFVFRIAEAAGCNWFAIFTIPSRRNWGSSSLIWTDAWMTTDDNRSMPHLSFTPGNLDRLIPVAFNLRWMWIVASVHVASFQEETIPALVIGQ